MKLVVDALVDLLKAAGEPTRFRLLVLLSSGDLTVTDLTEILGQSQPRISRHLKLLAEADLIDRYQEGRGPTSGSGRMVQAPPSSESCLALSMKATRSCSVIAIVWPA